MKLRDSWRQNFGSKGNQIELWSMWCWLWIINIVIKIRHDRNITVVVLYTAVPLLINTQFLLWVWCKDKNMFWQAKDNEIFVIFCLLTLLSLLPKCWENEKSVLSITDYVLLLSFTVETSFYIWLISNLAALLIF